MDRLDPTKPNARPPSVLRGWLVLVAIALLVMLAPACGGSVSVPPEESRADRLGHALDAAEERLDAERVVFDGLDPTACVDRCRSSTSICDASTEICGIARELGDPRSRARCVRAEDACHAVRERVSTDGCACAVPATDAAPTS